MDRKWWKEAVFYQIYPRSFYDSNGDGIGDLKGITEKLPYLKELGVTAVWICPFFKSPMKDNGYDISDYYDVNPEFGTIEDADELIRCANENGIKIIMDMVINHTSDQHRWFQEACRDRHSKNRPTPPPYRTEDIYQHRPIENTRTVTKRSFAPIQSEENKMIDKLNGEDFYDYSDYYDGLDGEHSDIDYNEIRDYFED